MNDPYVYPGTTILKNNADLRTQEELDRYERMMTFARLAEPLPDIPITYEGYKALHHHIFQDVFDWAGHSRTVALAKGNTFFGPPRYVDSEMTKRFQSINEQHNLQGLTPEGFASSAALHLNEINAIHPFREGNGRTQRLFLEALAAQAAHPIRAKDLHPESWHAASIQGFDGHHQLLSSLLLSAIHEYARTHEGPHDQERER
ncbi:MAG: putative adenosine monophosphate-protein transferase y4lH [Nitrospirales bacterium]|nr:MAG: putative adenosine monophosphate-protein transferase y4lH [Nitrospirales bacterium]